MGVDPLAGRPAAAGWALSSCLSLALHVGAISLLGATAALPTIPGPKGGSINVRILGAPGPGGPPAPAAQEPAKVVAAAQPVPVAPVAPPKETKATKVKPRAEKKKPVPARPAVARKRAKEERQPPAAAEAQPQPDTQFASVAGPAETASAAAGNGGGGGGGGGSLGTGGGSGGGHGSGSGRLAESSWTANLLAELRRQLEARKRYPRAARVRREEGTVVLRALLSSSGTVRNWEIAQASPFPALDDAALNAARDIQALRAKGYDDPPLEVSVVVPMRFSLSALR